MMLLVKLLLTLLVAIVLFILVATPTLYGKPTPRQEMVITFLKFVITVLIIATAVVAIANIWIAL